LKAGAVHVVLGVKWGSAVNAACFVRNFCSRWSLAARRATPCCSLASALARLRLAATFTLLQSMLSCARKRFCLPQAVPALCCSSQCPQAVRRLHADHCPQHEGPRTICGLAALLLSCAFATRFTPARWSTPNGMPQNGPKNGIRVKLPLGPEASPGFHRQQVRRPAPPGQQRGALKDGRGVPPSVSQRHTEARSMTPQEIVKTSTEENPVYIFIVRGCANCIALKRTIDKEFGRTGYKFMCVRLLCVCGNQLGSLLRPTESTSVSRAWCREVDKLPGMEQTALMDYLKELTGVPSQPWLFLRGVLPCLAQSRPRPALCLRNSRPAWCRQVRGQVRRHREAAAGRRAEDDA